MTWGSHRAEFPYFVDDRMLVKIMTDMGDLPLNVEYEPRLRREILRIHNVLTGGAGGRGRHEVHGHHCQHGDCAKAYTESKTSAVKSRVLAFGTICSFCDDRFLRKA
jgi:hypothetical protein